MEMKKTQQKGYKNCFFFFFFDKQEENIINKRETREAQIVHGSEQRKNKKTEKQNQPLIYSNR